MTKTEVMRALKAVGTAQNRKIYRRHGGQGEYYGVSWAELGKLKKKIKVDHDLALKLWSTGNGDARALATLIADADAMTRKEIDAWAKDLDSYGMVDCFAALVCKTRFVKPCMKRWRKAKSEWLGQAGWWLSSHLAQNDDSYSNAELAEWLEEIEAKIHTSKNRVRHSMNGALISIGIRNATLRRKAIAAAKRIGKVEVDHGETGCKTPDAIAYIEKTLAHRARKKT
jgi:3-methyladenine DNA glycosylase AlkD